MTAFADHFSAHAAAYAAARPTYPPELFAWLSRLADSPPPRWVWDCGTGSGQAAANLTRHFDGVIATDPSLEQIVHARRAPRVTYVAASAEEAPIATGSIALVTVAQALHWFDRPRFYAEVRRVAAERAWIAAWSYGHFRISAELDPLFDEFHYRTLAPYWPPERRLVDEGYRTIDFPFHVVASPPFEMSLRWTRDELIAYISTWSGVAAARRATSTDPVEGLRDALVPLWPDGAPRLVSWPLAVLAARVR